MSATEMEVLGPPGEPPLSEQVTETLRGRNRGLIVLVLVVTLAYAVLTVVSAVGFFRAEGLREMIAWAGGFFLGLIAVTSAKLWYFMELHKNAVLWEVKRVELQIARLAARLDRPA